MFLERMKKLDKTDRIILEILSENARASYVEISEKVKLSRVAVKARVQSLEERGIIEKYTAIINPHRMGRSISVYFEIKIDPTCYTEVVELLDQEDAITKVYQVTGSTKFHIHAIVDDEDELENLLQEVIYKLPGLRDVYFNTIMARIKDVKNIRL